MDALSLFKTALFKTPLKEKYFMFYWVYFVQLDDNPWRFPAVDAGRVI
jgi:hypothetical protein